ncbi:MAG: hypothetical protein ACFE8B_02250 [Candidatus Hermodarchaeota archaeon]
MRILKRNKPLILIFLILFPTLLIISSFSLNGKAGPAIPEPDPENGWHWDVNAGDELYYETEFIITNASTGEVSGMWRDIWIYNITSIENVTIDWLGVHEFSQVNATQCYYNVTSGELEPYWDSQEFALFGYNSTDPITHRIRAGRMGMPLLLPKNSSSLEVDILAPIINQSFYTPMGMSGFNEFDNYSYNVGLNRIYFWNSTDPYYSDATYYNDGTLDYGEAYLLVNMGDGPMYIQASMKQVFDYDITDEITWGVSPGQDIYYDWYEGSDWAGEAYDVKVHILGISDVLLNKTKNSFSNEEDDPVYMVYEQVIGDIYLWNGTDYELVEVDVPLGTANNFYPQHFDEEGPNLFNFIYPNNFALEDFEFMWNNDTLRIWDAPFDEIYFTENGMFESYVVNSTGTDMVLSKVDKTTGIVQSYLMTQGIYTLYYEIKVQTLVDWSVSGGEVLYYKQNEEEDFYDVRAIIHGTYVFYANLSAMLGPIGIPLPTGQPELQFYSCIYAEIDRWDPNTETWVFDDDEILAIANIYWPISPLQFEFGPPILVPQNTASADLSNLFDVFASVYDEITYTTGHVVLRNNTMDRELHFYFDETTGRVEMMYGWNADPISVSDWRYMSIYPKFYQALAPGSNSFTWSTDFPNGVTIDMEVEVAIGTPGTGFIYNQFIQNPVNVPVPVGTVMNYFDLLFENHSLIVGNITMIIHIPSSVDLKKDIFYFYAFNMSGTEEWDSPPPEFYLYQTTYDFVQNTITIVMEPFDRGVISCMAFFDTETVEEIPGFDLFLVSMLIVIVSGVLVKKIRRRN